MNKSREWKQRRHTQRVIRKQAKVRAQHRSGKGKRVAEPMSIPQAMMFSSALYALVSSAIARRDAARDIERARVTLGHTVPSLVRGGLRSQRKAA